MRPTAADREASSRIEEIYRTEAPRLWRALVLHTGDRERASDALSEAFAQALQRGDDLRDPVAWIWAVAFRIARSTRGPGAPGYIEPTEGDPLSDDVVDLVRALSRLSPLQRASAVLHYYGGYSLREIAEMLGSTRSAVGVHLYRARQGLRKELGEGDE